MLYTGNEIGHAKLTIIVLWLRSFDTAIVRTVDYVFFRPLDGFLRFEAKKKLKWAKNVAILYIFYLIFTLVCYPKMKVDHSAISN